MHLALILDLLIKVKFWHCLSKDTPVHSKRAPNGAGLLICLHRILLILLSIYVL